MSFGSFNLFGFYQQPGKGGQTFPTNLTTEQKQLIIEGGNNKAGTVADFNWFFPYADEIVPLQIVEGAGGAFQITLLSDSSLGIRYPIVSTNLSGSLYGDYDFYSSKTAMSGNFFPMDADFSTAKVVLSGLITGNIPDLISNSVILSGLLSGVVFDQNILYTVLSGSIIDGAPNQINLIPRFSGFINADLPDFPLISTNLSGKFFPLNNDYSNIQCSIESYSAGINYDYTGITFEDEVNNITYFLDSFTARN
jgi:hypothetical protein